MINRDGLVLVGTGSEWFWAAAQFVVVLVSLVAIYRQVRAQAAATTIQRMETLDARWSSPRMAHARFQLACHLRDETPNLDCYYKAMPILDFFADLMNLEIEGYVTVNEIGANWGRTIQEWTAFTRPLVDLRRREINVKVYDLEPLLKKLRAWEKKNKIVPADLQPETLPKLLDEAIQRAASMLDQEAAWEARGEPPARRTRRPPGRAGKPV